MKLSISSSRWAAGALLAMGLVNAHTVIVYPGYRGNNLHTNGSVEEADGLGAAYDSNNDTLAYPYGMQWIYPCGGMPTTTNRTTWPIRGGAVSFQPGWFQGHSRAMIYINLGLGTIPPNMSHPMIKPFEIVGPDNDPYPGTICLPQVPLPSGIEVNVGDNATIQVVETAQHGAALYNCADITFAEPEDVEEVTTDNCFNSSHISFETIFTTSSLQDTGLETIGAQLSNSSTQSAQSAATRAFLQSQPPSNNLSSAAAAAALRSLTPTPTPVENVQTKRMLQRQSSISSQPGGSPSLRPSSRNGLRRVNSSGSMAARTFRDQSPGRPTSSYSTMSTPAIAPPLPSIPPRYSAQNNQKRRSVSLGPSVWSPNSNAPAREMTRTSPPRIEPDSPRSVSSPGVAKPIPDHQRSESRNSINFSYPMHSRTNSPTIPSGFTHRRDEAIGTQRNDHTTPTSASHNRRISAQPNKVGRSPVQAAGGTALAAAQAVTVTRGDEPSTPPVASRTARPRGPAAYEQSPSRSIASIDMKPRPEAKKPVTIVEDRQIKERPEPEPVMEQKEQQVTKAVPEEPPRVQTPPVPRKSPEVLRTPPLDGELQLVHLRQPNSPGRSARFPSQLTVMNFAGEMHQPPPRSVSPAKSAMKVTRNSSLSPDGRITGILRPGPSLSELSDATSVASEDGARPNYRRKSVKVSFDDEAEVVGMAASPPTSPEEAPPESPPGKSKPKTSWFGLHKRKSSPLRSANADEFDGVLKPRAALPSFGSIRAGKDGARPDSSSSDSDEEDAGLSFSNDHAIGSIVSRSPPENVQKRVQTDNAAPAILRTDTDERGKSQEEDNIAGESDLNPAYFSKTPLSPLPEAPSEQSLPLIPNFNPAPPDITFQPATPQIEKERPSLDEYDDAAEFSRSSVEVEPEVSDQKNGKRRSRGSTDDDSSSIYSDAEEELDDHEPESEYQADAETGLAITSASADKTDGAVKETHLADIPETCRIARVESPMQDASNPPASGPPAPIESAEQTSTYPPAFSQPEDEADPVQGGIARSSTTPLEVHAIAQVKYGDDPDEVIARYDQAISNGYSKQQIPGQEVPPKRKTVKKPEPIELVTNGAGGHTLRRQLSNGSDSSSSFKRNRRATRGGMGMRTTMRGGQPSNSVPSSPTRPTVASDYLPLTSGLSGGTMRSTLRGNTSRKEKSLFSTSKSSKTKPARGPAIPFASRFPDSDSDSDSGIANRRLQRHRPTRSMSDNDMRPVRGIPRRKGAHDGDSTELEDSSDGERRPTSGPRPSSRQPQPATARDPALAAVAKSRGLTEEELEQLLSRGSSRKPSLLNRLSLKKPKPPVQQGKLLSQASPTNGMIPENSQPQSQPPQVLVASPSRLTKKSLHKPPPGDASWPLGSEHAEPVDFGIGSASSPSTIQQAPRPPTSDGIATNGNKVVSPRVPDTNGAQPELDEPFSGGHRASDVVIEGSGRKKRFQRLRNALKIR
ncbi:hypothetical protein BJX99DRAFT_272011 [Aspergillus californicus]